MKICMCEKVTELYRVYIGSIKHGIFSDDKEHSFGRQIHKVTYHDKVHIIDSQETSFKAQSAANTEAT